MLLLVCGKKRSGKDTLGDYLVSQYGFTKAQALAEPFKRAARDWFGWGEEHLNGELKEVVDPEWGFSPREFLQKFGTEVMKEDLGNRIPLYKEIIGTSIWVKVFCNWYNRQDPAGDYVLTDMRFPEEYDILSTLPNTKIVRTVSDRSPEDAHCSESYSDSFDVDFQIVNNGYYTFDEYYRNIDELMKQLKGGKV